MTPQPFTSWPQARPPVALPPARVHASMTTQVTVREERCFMITSGSSQIVRPTLIIVGPVPVESLEGAAGLQGRAVLLVTVAQPAPEAGQVVPIAFQGRVQQPLLGLRVSWQIKRRQDSAQTVGFHEVLVAILEIFRQL